MATATTHVNGIDTDALQQLMEEVKQDPARGIARFRVTSAWKGGTRTDARVVHAKAAEILSRIPWTDFPSISSTYHTGSLISCSECCRCPSTYPASRCGPRSAPARSCCSCFPGCRRRDAWRFDCAPRPKVPRGLGDGANSASFGFGAATARNR